MTDLEKTALWFARVRWVGVVLFAVGIVLLMAAMLGYFQGSVPGRRVVLSLLSCGLALGAFGSANDTALHAMHRLHGIGCLPSRHVSEWSHESNVRGERLRALHASPKTATFLPIIVVCLQGWLTLHLNIIPGLALAA